MKQGGLEFKDCVEAITIPVMAGVLLEAVGLVVGKNSPYAPLVESVISLAVLACIPCYVGFVTARDRNGGLLDCATAGGVFGFAVGCFYVLISIVFWGWIGDLGLVNAVIDGFLSVILFMSTGAVFAAGGSVLGTKPPGPKI